MTDGQTPVVEAVGLGKDYKTPKPKSLFQHTLTHAVRDVSFSVAPGETFGLVGESGCGKSTVAKLLMGLERPSAGEVVFRGKRLAALGQGELRRLRPRFQMVFQDSGSSLNSRKRVEDILAQPMLYHGIRTRKDVRARVDELMEMVGLPRSAKERYPHEFSGGQRQRVCIARALSLEPELIVLDEPVSALDVSVQAQIMNLLRDLQKELGMSYVFIGHGLGAVHYMSDRIAVMYMGQIVETGPSEEIFARPAHPYTKALLDAAPIADYALRNRKRVMLRGEAAACGREDGCLFRPRCPYATGDCVCQKLSGGPDGRQTVCLRALEEGGARA